IEVDPGQLEQVILNLVVNARDAMPEGGELDVAVTHRRVTGEVPGEPPAGHYAVLTVRDCGMAMDADPKGGIFEPFFMFDMPGRGAGLGLATVYGIATASVGTIRVVSTHGRGTTIDVYFPSVSEGPVDEDRDTALRGGSETLLLVEDDA